MLLISTVFFKVFLLLLAFKSKIVYSAPVAIKLKSSDGQGSVKNLRGCNVKCELGFPEPYKPLSFEWEIGNQNTIDQPGGYGETSEDSSKVYHDLCSYSIVLTCPEGNVDFLWQSPTIGVGVQPFAVSYNFTKDNAKKEETLKTECEAITTTTTEKIVDDILGVVETTEAPTAAPTTVPTAAPTTPITSVNTTTSSITTLTPSSTLGDYSFVR